MKIKTELFGKEIGTDNNITRAFTERAWQILLTLKPDDNRQRLEFIISKAEAETLIEGLQKCLEQGQEHQFRVV